MKRIFIVLLIMAMVLVYSVRTQAALEYLGTDSLGNGLIYDTDQNITWYDYTNVLDTWDNQNIWVSALSVTYGGNVYTDWRLPAFTDSGGCNYSYNGTNCGYNVDPDTGEVAHLFNELGNLSYYDTSGNPDQPGWGLIETGDFQNLQAGPYWMGTEYSPYTLYSWYFHLNYGNQEPFPNNHIYRGIAVRDGIPVVPVRIVYAPGYYSLIQTAYDAAAEDDIIQSQGIVFNEDLFIDDISNKTVFLECGYNSDFSSITGTTTVNGNMTVSNGTLIIANGVLELI